MRNSTNVTTSNMTKVNMEARSLKGLLMDKGREGLNEKIHDFLRKFELIQGAMASLVEQQRYSREQSGCDCLDLYLALNLKTGHDRLEAERIKTLSVSEIQLHHTKAAASLEWRARKSFAVEFGHPTTARVHAFNPSHDHYGQVREYVMRIVPDYYEVLAGYDAVRVSLNHALKNLRKTIFELSALTEDTVYPTEIEREAENMSKRIFKGLPESEAVAKVLNQLYN
jgi:hypothetical protein